jgi:hypothetical protein
MGVWKKVGGAFKKFGRGVKNVGKKVVQGVKAVAPKLLGAVEKLAPIAGTAVGAAFGNPAAGAQIGSAVGGGAGAVNQFIKNPSLNTAMNAGRNIAGNFG